MKNGTRAWAFQTRGSDNYPAIILIQGKFKKFTYQKDIENFTAIANKQKDGQAVVMLESHGGSVAAGIATVVDLRFT